MSFEHLGVQDIAIRGMWPETPQPLDNMTKEPTRLTQPDQKPLTCEVASIKANTSGDSRSGRLSPSGNVVLQHYVVD